MELSIVSTLIITYRYWILIPISFIEGPVVAFLAGALVPLGYFNIYMVFGILFARDLIFDSLYYALGRYGHKTRFAHWTLKKIGVTDDHLDGVRSLWQNHPFKTMFLGKLAYGIAVAFMVAAGLVNAPFKKFIQYSCVVAIFQYGVLVSLGYFLGSTFGNIIQIIIQDIAIVAIISIAIFISYHFFSRRMKKKLLRAEKRAENTPSSSS